MYVVPGHDAERKGYYTMLKGNDTNAKYFIRTSEEVLTYG
jgi:hypothetical protein